MNAVNLLILCTFNKSRYLLGGSFIHFLICEWNDSCDITLFSAGEDTKSLRYSPRDKQNQLNTTPCTTKDCWRNSRPCTVHYTYRTLQGELITSLCSASGLSETVSCSDRATGCTVRVLDPGRDMRFVSSLKCPDRLLDHSDCYSKSMGILQWGVKWLGNAVDRSVPFSGSGLWISGAVPMLPPPCLHGMYKTTFLNLLAPELFF